MRLGRRAQPQGRDVLLDHVLLTIDGERQEIASRLHDGPQQLMTAIRALPLRSRTIIALRYGADLPFGAVAAELRLSSAAARMAHKRALAQLRRALSEKEAT